MERRRRALLRAAGGLPVSAASRLPRAQPQQQQESSHLLKLPLSAPVEAAPGGVPGGSVQFIGTATVVLRGC